MKRVLSVILAIALLLGMAAFASADEEKVFNLVTSSKSISTKLDAVWVNRGDLFKTLVFRSLFLPDTTLTNLNPDIAASYTVSEDNLIYTVTMKDNVLWHDNEPITAEDVKWSIPSHMRLSDEGCRVSVTKYGEGISALPIFHRIRRFSYAEVFRETAVGYAPYAAYYQLAGFLCARTCSG